MSDIPDYKLKIFVDALIALETESSNAVITEDDLAIMTEGVSDQYDEDGDAADLREIHRSITKSTR